MDYENLHVAKLAATLILGVVLCVAAYVVVGMIGGANPQFSRGRSSISSVLVQEGAGALTLAVLAINAGGLIATVRGTPRGWPFILLPVGFLLAVVWWLALLVERAG
jgi:hypothetical protein